MTKVKVNSVKDTHQTCSFDLLNRQCDDKTVVQPGSLNITAKLNTSLKKAMRLAPKSREAMADEMSALLGIKITVSMLNNYTANSHPHRIPAEYIPAFCHAADTNEPITILTV